MQSDTIANALITIKNSELAAKEECICKPGSKLLGNILEVMKRHNYIADYKKVEDKKGGYYIVKLSHAINDCKAIKPRYKTKKHEFEKFERRYLPSRDMGILIVSTSQGVMTHKEAKEKGIGGRLLAYIY
ncbi:MAG: 30S ribosomal protein S8 [Candidatus Diapherotrites archaeon]